MGRDRKRKRGQKFDVCNKPSKHQKVTSHIDKSEPIGLKIIYKNLQSVHPSEALQALHTMGALAAEGSKSVEAIVFYKELGSDHHSNGALVRKAAELALHQNNAIKLAAVGALRNLSACGNDNHILLLLQNGVFEVAHQLIAISQPFNEADGDAKSELFSTLEQACHLIANICEVSDTAVINTEDIIPKLLEWLTSPESSIPHELVLASATALLCITEDNPDAAKVVLKRRDELINSAAVRMNALATAEESHAVLNINIAVTVLGILVNMNEVKSSNEDLVKDCFKYFSVVLNSPFNKLLEKYITPQDTETGATSNSDKDSPKKSINEAVEDLSPTLAATAMEESAALESLEANGIAGEEGGDEDEEMVLTFEQASRYAPPSDNGCLTGKNFKIIKMWLEAQHLALELIANILFGGDDTSSYDEETDSDRPGLVLWPEGEKKPGTETNKDKKESSMDIEECDSQFIIQEQVHEHNIVGKIMHFLEPLNPTVETSLGESKFNTELQSLIMGLRDRSLAALQPAIECLTVEQLGGSDGVLQMWLEFRKLAYDEPYKCTEHTMEAVTAAMRTLVSKFTSMKVDGFSEKILLEIELLCKSKLSYGVAVARYNFVRLLGILCSFLIPNEAHMQLDDKTKAVLVDATKMLVTLAGTDRELWVSAEALDVIIDLYSEDQTDSLALECDLVNQLKLILHYFNARFKKEKNSLKEHRVLLVTVRDNLPEFIKYKEPRVLNAHPSKKHPRKESKVRTNKKDKSSNTR